MVFMNHLFEMIHYSNFRFHFRFHFPKIPFLSQTEYHLKEIIIIFLQIFSFLSLLLTFKISNWLKFVNFFVSLLKDLIIWIISIFYAYLINQKIERVKELLFYDELSLSEIADKLGYSSVAHLSAQFKKVTGLTPSELKKSRDIDKNRKSLDNIS